MTSGKPIVVVTRKLPDQVETRMMELFDARLNTDDHPFTTDELVAAMAEAHVLVPTVTDTIDADVIAAAGENLKLIANFGTGINHVDLAAAEAAGITVTNTPGVLTEDTADLTMALILAAPRRIGEGERLLRSGKWKGWAPTFMLGHRIAGQRLGIIGMGRIGQAVARRARGTPRIAGRLLRRVRDFALVENSLPVDRKVADHALSRLDVDDRGLDTMDRRYLRHIAEVHFGGPVGIDTLAAALSEERDTLEDVVEPYLIQQGFIQRTPRGRMLTPRAYGHLGLDVPKGAQEDLLSGHTVATNDPQTPNREDDGADGS